MNTNTDPWVVWWHFVKLDVDRFVTIMGDKSTYSNFCRYYHGWFHEMYPKVLKSFTDDELKAWTLKGLELVNNFINKETAIIRDVHKNLQKRISYKDRLTYLEIAEHSRRAILLILSCGRADSEFWLYRLANEYKIGGDVEMMVQYAAEHCRIHGVPYNLPSVPRTKPRKSMPKGDDIIISSKDDVKNNIPAELLE